MRAMYSQLLNKYPVRTKIISSCALTTSGDAMAQFLDHRIEKWDGRRSFAMAIFGAFYLGGFQHYLFIGYSRLWPVVREAPLFTKVSAAAKTTAFHMIATYPIIYFPAFFAVTDTLGSDRSMDEIIQRIKTLTWPMYKQGFGLWVPAMFAQFLLIPLQYQILFMNSVSFCWTTYLSLSVM